MVDTTTDSLFVVIERKDGRVERLHLPDCDYFTEPGVLVEMRRPTVVERHTIQHCEWCETRLERLIMTLRVASVVP